MDPDEPGVNAFLARPESAWVTRDIESRALAHAIDTVVPEHLAEVREPRLALLAKTEAAVKERLTREINHWDHRAAELRDQERAGKANARLNSDEAAKRADALQARLSRRMEEIALERQISALPPVVLGGLLVVPAGLLSAMTGAPLPTAARVADTQASAARARAAVMAAERALGFVPVDRELERSSSARGPSTSPRNRSRRGHPWAGAVRTPLPSRPARCSRPATTAP
jgi:hypothetical protein